MSVGLSEQIDFSRKKLAIPIFNRATYGRCREFISSMNKHPNFEVTLFVCGHFCDDLRKKNYVEEELKEVKIEYVETENNDTSRLGSIRLTAALLSSLGQRFERQDVVAVVGDRFETMAAALAAAYLNIPLVHIQGGEVTGNIDEKVRHAVTKLADYHFVATKMAQKYIVQMGEETRRVFNTGCPSLDIIKRNLIKRHKTKEKYIICQFHPHTKESDEAYNQTRIVAEAVIDFVTMAGCKCYWYWPNPDPGREDVIRLLEEAHKANPEFLYKAANKPPEDFLYQLAGSQFVIGNSSVTIRESAFMGLPAINIGDRQSIRERSWNVIDCDFDKEALIKAMWVQFETKKYQQSFLFGDGRAAAVITEYIGKLDLTIKGPLTYPNWHLYREAHFGESRLKEHRRNRLKREGRHTVGSKESERKYL